jgi:phospholipase C
MARGGRVRDEGSDGHDDGAAVPDELTRRQVLGAAVAGAGGILLGDRGLARALGAPEAAASPAALPPPGSSGIEHVVVVMMENRSFDHFLGWLPGADGRQAGLSYPGRHGGDKSTYHLATYQGCGYKDPDHSYRGGRVQYHDGKCDGWLLDGQNDIFCIGYYEQSDLGFYARAAPYWTVCDHYFAATMAPTYPNRFYMHSAQTDRKDDSTTISTLPTIWDRLAAANVSHNYFFSDVPFTALWGARYAGISQPIDAFYAACLAGQLPAVSYVDPRFEDEGNGTSGDDHPFADIRVGQGFVNQVYQAVTGSPNWDSTVLFINYDEWGGFFDHVAPSTAPDNHPMFSLRGFRVPAFVISPFSRRRHIAHRVYDHTSILKLIEWRWGLAPLTRRDAAARNIAEVLDFSRRNLTAPQWSVPVQVPVACSPAGTPAGAPTEHELTWHTVAEMAAYHGFTR